MMQIPTQAAFNSTSNEFIPGLSDEEELRRMGQDISGAMGIGDVYAEIDADALELGFRQE